MSLIDGSAIKNALHTIRVKTKIQEIRYVNGFFRKINLKQNMLTKQPLLLGLTFLCGRKTVKISQVLCCFFFLLLFTIHTSNVLECFCRRLIKNYYPTFTCGVGRKKKEKKLSTQKLFQHHINMLITNTHNSEYFFLFLLYYACFLIM